MNYRSRYSTALGQLQSLPGASSSLPLFVLQRWSSHSFPYYTLHTHTHTHTPPHSLQTKHNRTASCSTNKCQWVFCCFCLAPFLKLSIPACRVSFPGGASFQRILEKSQTRARYFCSESCLLDANENEASPPGNGTSPLHPALGAHPARLTPAGRKGSALHTMAVGRGMHTARACHRKLKCALKTQPFLGIKGSNYRKKCKCTKSQKKKKLVILTTATLAVQSRV